MKKASDIFKDMPDGSGFVDGTVLDKLDSLAGETERLSMSEQTTEKSRNGDRVQELVRRLIEHADCHEYIANNSDEQKQWMNDLRHVATLLDMLQHEQKRMRDPERTLVSDIIANGQLLPDPNETRYPPNDIVSGGVLND